MDSGILDVVLALYRSPALRFELRERPLPDAIDVVLQVAAPCQPLLDDTAARLGEVPDTLLEAARFYLQQVLFEPGTDAYRILGVPPDAALARIRDHHHWLQRWLHPDRAGANANATAAFAARLNWAWQQLRNERNRSAYDAERAPRKWNTTGHDTPKRPPRVGQWIPLPVVPSARPGRWWRRGILGVVLGSCVLLFYLAWSRSDLPPDAMTQPARLAVASQPATTAPASAAVATAPVAPPPPSVHKSVRIASAAQKPARTEPISPVARTSIAQRATSQVLPVAPKLRVAKLVADATSAKPGKAASRATLSRPAVAVATADTSHPPSAPPAPRLAHLHAVTTEPAFPAVAAVRLVVMPAPTTASATPITTAASGMASAPSQPVAPVALLQRVTLARERVRLLVGYFRSTNHGVPRWQPAGAPFNAPLQRAALRQRNGLPTAATFALDTPVWRVKDGRIAMDANYHVERDRRITEQGRLHVRMHWHDDTWQITHIALEPRG